MQNFFDYFSLYTKPLIGIMTSGKTSTRHGGVEIDDG